MVMSLCGNGMLNPGEQCDDGNDDGTDECTNVCSFPRCGDGFVAKRAFTINGEERWEECDDGVYNTLLPAEAGACRPNCLPQRCGDAIVDAAAGEQCDDGNTDENDGCTTRCEGNPCGDGILAAEEECDDGNQLAGDGCSPLCRTEPRSSAASFASSFPVIAAASSASSARTDVLYGAAEVLPELAAGTLPAALLEPPLPGVQHGPVGSTGPAALLTMVSGAAAGYAFLRRRK